MFIRKNNRLPNKTLYASNHRYFITICTHNRKCILTVTPDTLCHNNNPVAPDTVGHQNNKIVNDNQTIVAPDTVGHQDHIYQLPLTQIGKIIETTRYALPNMFGNIILDAFIVMPNHIHGIVGFDGIPYSIFTNKETNLGNIIKRFKLETGNQCKKHAHLLLLPPLPLRQKSFHDHVIRNQEELLRIQQYIINNNNINKYSVVVCVWHEIVNEMFLYKDYDGFVAKCCKCVKISYTNSNKDTVNLRICEQNYAVDFKNCLSFITLGQNK